MVSAITEVAPMWDDREKCYYITKEMALIWFFMKEY